MFAEKLMHCSAKKSDMNSATRQHLHLAMRDPADVLDHATTEMSIGSKMGFDATKKIPGEGHKRGWPPLIKMDSAVGTKINQLFNR